MKIRLANKFDQPFLLDVLKQYQQQTDLPETSLNSEMVLKEDYISKLFHHILLGGGLGLVAEKDNKAVGILLALCNSTIWDPEVKTLNHLLLWVEPSARTSTAAMRLLRAYNEHGNKMIKENKIKMFSITKAYHLKKLNLEKMGFKKAEETWCIGL